MPADPLTGRYPQIIKKGFTSEQAAKSAMMKHIRELDEESLKKPTVVTFETYASKGLKETENELRPWTKKTCGHVLPST